MLLFRVDLSCMNVYFVSMFLSEGYIVSQQASAVQTPTQDCLKSIYDGVEIKWRNRIRPFDSTYAQHHLTILGGSYG